MNSSWKWCSLLTIVLATCIHEGLSIKCWECRSDFDPACADEFDNSTMPITDCNQHVPLYHMPELKPTMCRKIRQRVNGQWKTIRGCAFLGEPGVAGNEKLCLTPMRNDWNFIQYCTCNSRDGCNTGPTVYSNQLFIQFAVFLCFVNNFFNR